MHFSLLYFPISVTNITQTCRVRLKLTSYYKQIAQTEHSRTHRTLLKLEGGGSLKDMLCTIVVQHCPPLVRVITKVIGLFYNPIVPPLGKTVYKHIQ